ncbi:MAG TPA: protein kinase [Pyrinomonadaceae bacterium]|jgi:serine/threonine protein kinase
MSNDMICDACKTTNESGDLFCRECGHTLTDASQMPTIQGVGNISAPLPSVSGTAARGGDPLIGYVIDGRYRIDAKLGIGGMGAVYKGTRLLIGDEVAIKVLHKEQVAVPEAAERFRREAQAAARLKHANAVSVYDFGVSQEGLFYLVMELVEGESVRSIIRQRGPLTPTATAEIITQVCAALDEAHRHGIIHRDIKPDNIMVHQGVAGLRVKVLDFGIAKLRDQAVSNLTQTGSVMGTPHYMSPEQCIGEELDSRSDIYSLGIVMYEMLAGVVPFNSPTSTAVVVQHVNQPPPPIRAMNMSIPQPVEAVVLHALEKRREARPQTAGALAHELSAALGMSAQPGSTVAAHMIPPTSPSGPLHGSGAMPTMVMAATPSTGSPAAIMTGPQYFTGSTPQVQSKSKYIFIPLAVILVAALGGLAYFLLTRTAAKTEGSLPDHFGIFVRNKEALVELRRAEFRDVIQGRDALLGDSSLPRVEPKPTLILYAEGQDIPVADLKLVQLDSIDPGGKVPYWNYQVAPVEGRAGMKQIKVSGGLPSGKYAFALLNGYMDEGNHKFWPFQVRDDAPAPADTPQLAALPLKPKPSPTVSTPAPQQQTASAPSSTTPPLPPPVGAGLAYCSANNVVLRSAPNLNGPKIGKLSMGQRLYVIELSSNYDTWRGITANWAYVQPENSTVRGWVFAYFVRR